MDTLAFWIFDLVLAVILCCAYSYRRGLRLGEERAVVAQRDSMTFAAFTKANKIRSVETFHREVHPDSAIAFALGVGEEAGEVLGKVRAYLGITKRKKGVTPEDIGAEIADLVHYADLVAECYGLRLEDCLQAKYNAVSKRSGSDLRLVDGCVVRGLGAL